MKPSLDSQFHPPSLNARAAIVNRTHRVVRERAQQMQARKRRLRDLLVPSLICSALLWFIGNAVMSVADHDPSLGGIEEGLWRHVKELGSDAGTNISLVLMWFLPLTVLTAAVIILRRSRSQNGRDEVTRS